MIAIVTSPGVDNGDTMKVSGSGGADPDRSRPGDLYVTIKVCVPIWFDSISWL